jgi:hypothetical protein
MASTRTVNRSFAGGEIGPDMFGRIDDQKYQSGAALVRNFITLPQGPAQNRPGFEYVNATKNNGVARLIPFIYNIDQTMVIELGNQYARFHTNAETVVYDSSTLKGWIGPAGSTSYTLTTPTVITWTGNGLAAGDPIRFYATSSDPLPIGLQVGYTYTVDPIDANTFYIKDANGFRVGLSAPPGGSLTYTNYPGSGSASAHVSLAPNQVGSNTSPTVGGLASLALPGGSAMVNVSISTSGYYSTGTSAWQALLQSSIDGGSTWQTIYGTNAIGTTSVRVAVNLSNLNQLQLRVYVSATTGPSASVSITAAINSWSVDVPTGGTGGPTATVISYRYYTAGDAVTYGGSAWQSVRTDSGGITVPGTNPAIWAPLPANAVYEIPTPYVAADLFDIHYVQSADVITLVHPNYPPMELKRLGTTTWTLTNVAFQPSISPPANVAVAASPGFKVKIQSISGTLITTVTNHTLSLGDQIYIDSLVANSGGDKSGFYLVSEVPVNTSTGALILNELRVMDYNGVQLDATSWGGYTGSPTIQLATKSYDPTSHYVVTAIAADGVDESKISSDVSVLNNLDVPGSFNTISWSAVDGTLRYNIYKQRNGLYGYIGETPNLSFVDDNIAPDFSITPPNYEIMFASPGDYPAAVGYAEQRKCYAGTDNQPQNLWMSNSGTEDTFSYSLPIKDTDRIAIAIASREANIIRHIVPMTELMLLTSSAEIVIKPANSDVITPTTISAKPQTYVGANNVQPSVINTALVYCAARGGHVRELGYAWTVNGFTTGDLSLRAAHLFDNLTLVDMAYQKAPRPILWFVSSGGSLLGLTYVPEEQIGAWHHHDTGGYGNPNQLQNPNFDQGSTGWGLQSGWSVYAGGRPDGTNGNMGVYGGPGTAAIVNDQHIPCTPGTEISASCDALGEPGATGNAVLRISFYDALFNFISDAVSATVPANYIWTPVAVTATAPANTALAMVDFAVFSAGTGGRWWVTNFNGGHTPLAAGLDSFESVACVAEGGEDRLYAVIRRTINGQTVRYVERMASRILVDQAHGFFVDAGASYDGPPVTTISGLDWLEGMGVKVLADGAVYEQALVSGGQIALKHPASVITVGIPYTCDLATLPPVLQVDGFGQGRMLNINRVWMKVYESSQILIGPDQDHLTPYKQRTTEPWGSPPGLVTGQIGPIVITPEWGAGTVFIRQQDPLPITVLGLTMELSIGG